MTSSTEGIEQIRTLSTKLAALILESTKAVDRVSERYTVPEVEATVIDNIFESCRCLVEFDCYQYIKEISRSGKSSTRKSRKEALDKIWKDMCTHEGMCSLYQKNNNRSNEVRELREALFNMIAFPLLEKARQMKEAVNGEVSKIEAIESERQKGRMTLSPLSIRQSWGTQSQRVNRSVESSPGTPKSPTWSIPSFKMFGRPRTSTSSSLLGANGTQKADELAPSTSTITGGAELSNPPKELSPSAASSFSIAPEGTKSGHKPRVDSFEPEKAFHQTEATRPVLIIPDPDRHRTGSNDIVTSPASTQRQSSQLRFSLLVPSAAPPIPVRSPLRQPSRQELVPSRASKAEEETGRPLSLSSFPLPPSPLGNFQKFAESRTYYEKYTPPAQQEIRYSSFWPEDGSRLVSDSESGGDGDGTGGARTRTPSFSNVSGASGGTSTSASPESLAPTTSTARLHLFPPRRVPPEGNAIRHPSRNRFPPRSDSLGANSIPSTPSTSASSKK